MLLKEALGHVQSKPTILFTTFSDRTYENENIIQMMTKIQRAAKPRKTIKVNFCLKKFMFFVKLF